MCLRIICLAFGSGLLITALMQVVPLVRIIYTERRVAKNQGRLFVPVVNQKQTTEQQSVISQSFCRVRHFRFL
jgi:hypothetical protein